MDRTDAERLDADDALADFREAFELPTDVIYLDGNSLGPLPRSAVAKMDYAVRHEWGELLIRGWNDAGWIYAPQRVGAKIARLIGAGPDEVIVADSTSVNLFKAVSAAMSANPGRRSLLTEAANFPTDLYILQGIADATGARLDAVEPSALLGAIGDDTAAVVLTHVHYTSARRWDLPGVTASAHQHGALAVWDLSHTAGAVAVDLNAANADFAVGCGYKYLNGGPGAPAWLFAASRHLANLKTPLQGWMGHLHPFGFDDQYRPSGDIRGLLTGTPPVLGLTALECGVDLQVEADPRAAEAKGLALAQLFIRLVGERGLGLELVGPRAMTQRGLHVSFRHSDGFAVIQALIARGVIGDFRAPDVIRFGFSPLFVRFVDVWDAVEILAEVIETRAYDRPEFRAWAAVT